VRARRGARVDDLLLVPASQILEGHAKAILLDMSPEIDHEINVVFMHMGRRVEITYHPAPELPPSVAVPNLPRPAPLTPCEQDILAVFHELKRVLKGPEVIDALAERNCVHADSSVHRYLPNLVRNGHLIKVGPKHGYRLPD
jgi:hypothetical protein